MSGFTVEAWPLVTHQATVVRVTHPQYGRAEQVVDDVLIESSKISLVERVVEHMQRMLMQGPVARRQTISEILQGARVTP